MSDIVSAMATGAVIVVPVVIVAILASIAAVKEGEARH